MRGRESLCTPHITVVICTYNYRDEPTQLACLRIVRGMLPHLSGEQLCSLVPFVTAFGSHLSLECREVMYDVLTWIYNNFR